MAIEERAIFIVSNIVVKIARLPEFIAKIQKYQLPNVVLHRKSRLQNDIADKFTTV